MKGGGALAIVACLVASVAQAQSGALTAAARDAVAAGADAALVEELVGRWAGRGYPESDGTAVLAAIADSARQGLPTTPLVQKTIEGLAKGVPPQQIAQAVGRRARALREAAGVLEEVLRGVPQDGPGRARALHAVADALFQGAAADLVRTVA
ncbi:MAG TPA: hypothetical protein VNM66_01120, partial [Thermodesulfobacteriota bacterium]|nr:hypothetical protein [Thermodesulfobacteriota bacterium]